MFLWQAAAFPDARAVIAKIISMQSSLTVSENEIAQYVINHPDQVVVSTITAAAQSTHTSEASINRFCKKRVLDIEKM